MKQTINILVLLGLLSFNLRAQNANIKTDIEHSTGTIAPKKSTQALKNGQLTFSFPTHAFTQIKLSPKK